MTKQVFSRAVKILGLLSVVLIIGCGDSINSTGEPVPRGTMVGNVALYKAMIPQTDMSGITVTLEETGQTATTDKFGEWRIDNVPTRTYTIKYEMDGYGLMKQPMTTFIGGSIVRVPSTALMSIPSCGSIFDDVRQIDTSYMEAYAHATCSDHDSNIGFINEYILFVFSNSRDVSADPDKHQFSMIGQTPQPRGTAAIFVAKQQLERYLNMDDSIYVAAYNTSGSGWVDPLTQKTIYSGHNLDRDRTLAFKWQKD
jgi:hypothetical protein